MPKVTLLSKGWKEYTVAYGKGLYNFRGGEPKGVPVAVALLCKKMKDEKGLFRFKVDGMPNILKKVVHAKVPVPKTKQNVDSPARQLRLADAVS